MPVATLSNGLRVANFSSPHTFEFEDGTVLAACEPDRVEAGSVKPVEKMDSRLDLPSGKSVDIVTLAPDLTIPCHRMLDDTYDGHGKRYDVVIVSLMLREAINKYKASQGRIANDWWSHCVTIRRRDRGGPICIDKFCR